MRRRTDPRCRAEPLHRLLRTGLQLGAGAALCAACSGTTSKEVPPPEGDASLRLEEVARGLQSPLFLTAPAGDARLFVVEQVGRIRVLEQGELRPTPFLDLTDRVLSGGERGLLSLAFHPAYAANGYFFVNYTDRGGDTRVERYRVGTDANLADPTSAQLVLRVEQPFGNHNGGLIKFGPDGMLYVGMGDGGSGGDPQGHGQNRGTLLGALLRLDVDAAEPYAVPPDNPFVGDPASRAEIWAYGLRNPWRFSFDPPGGLLYLGDVGQNRWEEVNVAPAQDAGLNFGWNILEASECFPTAPCDRSGLVLPVIEYRTGSEGCSVIGGYVYRGQAIPSLRGHYFYSDFCGGWLRSFRYADGEAGEQRQWPVGNNGNVLSLGEDAAGELYLLAANGRVYRIAPGP